MARSARWGLTAVLTVGGRLSARISSSPRVHPGRGVIDLVSARLIDEARQRASGGMAQPRAHWGTRHLVGRVGPSGEGCGPPVWGRRTKPRPGEPDHIAIGGSGPPEFSWECTCEAPETVHTRAVRPGSRQPASAARTRRPAAPTPADLMLRTLGRSGICTTPGAPAPAPTLDTPSGMHRAR